MLTIADFLAILSFSTLGGLLSGMLGVGGGVIFIPILEYYFLKNGLSGAELVRFTLANSFFVIVFSGLIISYRQWKLNNFYIKPVIYTSVTGLISCQLVTYLILQSDWYKQESFKIVFLAMLIPMTLRMFLRKERPAAETDAMPGPVSFGIVGFITGMVTSLSGLGGGIIMVPVFSDLMKIPIRKATSISTGVIPFLTLSLVISYVFKNPVKLDNLQAGYIIFPLTAPMILGVLLVAPLGVRLAHKIKPLHLRIIFACVASIIIIKEIYEYEPVQNFISRLFTH